jgi:sugar phosphate isomerase/epimerase
VADPASPSAQVRLAFSTNASLKYPFADAVQRLAAIGYAGVEVMADVPHAWPPHLLEEQKQEMRRVLSAHGLAISNVNGFMMKGVGDHRQPYWHPSWIEADPHYRQVRIDHTRRCLTLAREIGAPSITTEPGGPLDPGTSRGAGLRLFAEGLKPVAEHAERKGVHLLIEPEPGLLVENTEQFLELMHHVKSPSVGLNFDVGHFYCVGDDPATAIARLAPYIHHFHLEDIAASRVHHHLIPGDGAIDFAAVFRAMEGIDYRGWVTIELYPYVDDPDTAARAARERVLAILARS